MYHIYYAGGVLFSTDGLTLSSMKTKTIKERNIVSYLIPHHPPFFKTLILCLVKTR